MRTFLIASLIAFALSTPALAQPGATEKPARVVQLKDGSTLQIYNDGKMSMHDNRDRPMPMKPGTKMETKGGEVLMMQGNEVWRQIRPNQIGD